MIIRTPSDLLGYLQALAMQHPLVSCVILGEMSRPEAGTRTTNTYPLVLIEWPSVRKPRSGGPLKIMTRMFVLSTSSDGYASEDTAASDTYNIAFNIVATLQMHSYDEAYAFSLSAEEMPIDPVEYMGSDQQRGWMFPIEAEIDQSLCQDNPLDPADLSIPQFTWENKTTENLIGYGLSFEDISIHGTKYESSVWYWQEQYEQALPTTFDPDDGLEAGEILDLGITQRIIQVWLKITTTTGLVLWAYARIDSRETSGRSTPFIPTYPI